MASEEAELKSHGDYTVGWICALSVEQTAATGMLDTKHGELENPPHDTNAYTLGSIGKHNVVIACCPEGTYGTNSAASVVTLLAGTFPSIRSCFMVGIAGGVPSNKVRLGDVVVGVPQGAYPGVVQWDMGKAKQGGLFERTGSLDKPPKALLTSLAKLRTENELKGSRIPMYLDELKTKYPKAAAEYLRSDSLVDILFKASYDHVECPSSEGKSIDEEEEDEDEESEEDENCPYCDKTRIVKRRPRDMLVHYGTIASGNQVIKEAKFRDKLNKDLGGNILCIEMEAAGILSYFPCLVIRGICDYADSHKNKDWQKHAAAVAAAFAKELLLFVQPSEVQRDHLIKDVLHEEIQQVQTGINHIGKVIENGFTETKTGLENINRDTALERKNHILNWLSNADHGLYQNDYISRREAGTGGQFLRSFEFRTWLEHDINRQPTRGPLTLFSPGIPGAGKTIQASVVIDYLTDRYCNDPDIGVAYIYCHFQRQQEQTANSLLANLIKQLARSKSPLPKGVEDLYERFESKGRSPSEKDLSKTFKGLVSLYSRVFIAIDALDECDDTNGERRKFLDALLDSQESNPFSLFVTSRFIGDIERRFRDVLQMEIKPDRGDIYQFIERRMGELPDFVEDDEKLQWEIKASIEGAIDGIFLLAGLYLDSLIGKRSPKSLRGSLIRLRKEPSKSDKSSALDEAYQKAMERIQHQKGDMTQDAILALSWIVNAKRQLTVNELQEALSIEEGTPKIWQDNMPRVEHILKACAPLVVIDELSNIIRLVHYTAQTYLERTRDVWFKDSEAKIARMLITYLSFDTFESGPCGARHELDQRHKRHVLYPYASQYWGEHASRARRNQMSAQELLRFLESSQKRDAAYQSLLLLTGSFHSLVKDTAMHIVAYFGLWQAISPLAEKGSSLNDEDAGGRTPLILAILRPHVPTVDALLESGADPEARGLDTRPPLLAAVASHYTPIVKLLLERGAHPDSHALVPYRIKNIGLPHSMDEEVRIPLFAAARRGSEDMVKLLLEYNASVEVKDSAGMSPLACAVARKHLGIANLLLHAGANVDSQDVNGTTILHRAAWDGHGVMVQMLLRHGADIDLKSKGGETALAAAIERGHTGVARLLLEEKAEVNYLYHLSRRDDYYVAVGDVGYFLPKIFIPCRYNLPEGDYNKLKRARKVSPLRRAAELENIKMVELLMKWNAQLDPMPFKSKSKKQGNDFAQKSLHQAVFGENLILTKLLLTQLSKDGAIVGTYGERALYQAQGMGSLKMMALLLSLDEVDPNAKDKKGRTPLIRAVQRFQSDKVSNLKPVESNPDPADNDWRTLIPKIMRGGHKCALEMLLECDRVDPNLGDEEGRTPIFYAVCTRNLPAIKLLMSSQRVNPDVKDVYGRTPLSYAVGLVPMCDPWVVEELLACDGVDPNSRDNQNRTPLDYAIYARNQSIINILMICERSHKNWEDSGCATPCSSDAD